MPPNKSHLVDIATIKITLVSFFAGNNSAISSGCVTHLYSIFLWQDSSKTLKI